MNKQTKRLLVLVIAGALSLVGAITISVTSSTDETGHKSRSVVLHVDGKDRDRARDDTVTVPRAAIDQAKQGDLGDHLAAGLRDESPPGVSPVEINASIKKQERLAANDQLPIVQPDAAPVQRGCRSEFVRNYSTRRGVRPREWTLHYTVSPNRPGWSDVNAVVALFNTSRSQASSNYVVDAEGHCAYIVRESDKAWTQAGGNPYSISVEIINSGHEETLAGSAGLKKVGLIISDSAKRWQIPLSRGIVAGCIPVKPGIIQHKDWGLCGGGHFDIAPFSVAPVIQAAVAARSGGCSARCRRARDLRKRHRVTHLSLRTAKGSARRKLRTRNRALHKAAKKERISL